MVTGWRYRASSAIGAAVATVLAVAVANHQLAQTVFTTYVPLFWRLEPVVLSGGQFALAVGMSAAVVVGSHLPLYKPRPRRVLDTVSMTHKRLVVAGCVLATIGFFKWSHRLPRATLVMTIGVLGVVLPAWFVAIRSRPSHESTRAIVVGDDPDAMAAVLESVDVPVLGYVSPPSRVPVDGIEPSRSATPITATDGGEGLATLSCLGGLSRLDEVFVDHDVDTAVLAFAEPDRAEFFGALDACYENGVTAKVHRRHADSVLTRGYGSDELVDIDLEPWDATEHMLKRAFDVAFSIAGLIALTPVLICITVAIKLDDGGSLLYSQERTATFGDTFRVYKFRSMVEGAESASGVKISDEDNGGVDPRVTRIGSVLRPTHLDEIPQLWSILVGDMSVVGPRPERPELEVEMEADVIEWRSRWFVKPGLTGLAQINDVTGHDPDEKLRYDVEYIRRQSLWFDLKIVIRQLWQVLSDAAEYLSGRDSSE